MKRLNLIYSLLLLLLLVACKQQEQPWAKEENQAKVSLVLSLSADKDTRGNVSTYPKDPSKWTDAEKLADGRYFEYITVLILKGNVLQAYEDLDVTNKASQAVIEFDRTFVIPESNDLWLYFFFKKNQGRMDDLKLVGYE